MQIDGIDWRADALRVQRSKANARAVLPMMGPVGEAILLYLREGRPLADVRTVFLRSRAPYQTMTVGGLYGVVKRRLAAAGIEPVGKRGPHIFRYARAVSMLRASTSGKIIGGVLGPRSLEPTALYLKLATEDLRSIAIELPSQEVNQCLAARRWRRDHQALHGTPSTALHDNTDLRPTSAEQLPADGAAVWRNRPANT